MRALCGERGHEGSAHGFGGALRTEQLPVTKPVSPRGERPRRIPHEAPSPPSRPGGVP